jgi:hypothetical protein
LAGAHDGQRGVSVWLLHWPLVSSWLDSLLLTLWQIETNKLVARGLGYGERKGIREGHAYSVMRAVEMDGQRLLLLKNPWGKGEWTGPWSMCGSRH